MWPFKRKRWEKLGSSWDSRHITAILKNGLTPTFYFAHDRNLRALSVKDFEKLVFDCWFPKDWPAYKPEAWDCDDFAHAFAVTLRRHWVKVARCNEALAFGVIVGYLDDRTRLHAFIWQVDDRGLIHFYEPQTGKRISSRVKETLRIDI